MTATRQMADSMPGGVRSGVRGFSAKLSVPPTTTAAMTPPPATLDFGPGLDLAARSLASFSALHPLENQDNLVLIDGTGRARVLRDQAEHALHVAHWPSGHARVAVLDGMGGHGHGREAAEAAAQAIVQMPACATLAQLCERLDALHWQLQCQFSAAGERERRPGTTLTLLELRPGLAPLLYHVGDSRLYEITAHRARPLTIDHVPATTFALHGLLGPQEWWQQVHEEHRPHIAQAFMLGNAFAPQQRLEDGLQALDAACLPPFLRTLADRRALEVRADALYLLATDGFWACQRPQDWTACWPALLGRAATCADALAALFATLIAAPPPGLHADNLTAIALRFTDAAGAVNLDETALPTS